jgi:hypothetical protein
MILDISTNAQARIETAWLLAAGIRKGRLGYSMVLRVEVEDNLIAWLRRLVASM